MADIDISVGELPEAEYFDGESILLVENQGQAQRISGQEIQDFAAQPIANLTVLVQQLLPGASATVKKELVDGIYRFVFGIPAGADGVSPVATIESITGGHRVTITDAEGSKSFEVKDGKDGSGLGETGQADLAQNDPSQPDYVKGRTHWHDDDGFHPLNGRFLPDSVPWVENYATDILSCEVLLDDNGEAKLDVRPEIFEGGEYVVSWNGAEFNCEAMAFEENGAYIGMAIGSGDPFIIILVTEDMVETVGSSFLIRGTLDYARTVVDLRISRRGVYYHKLQKELLPDDAPFVSATEQSLTEEQKAQAQENIGLGGLVVSEGGDTLTWDGNTEGRESIDFGYGYICYKVSNSAPSFGDFTDFVLVYVAPEGNLTVDVDVVELESGAWCLVNGVTILAFFAPSDVEGEDYGVVATKGTYFPDKAIDGIGRTSSLTIPGYTGFAKKQIKTEYIPESVPQVQTASVGQTIVVSEVDADGKPTKWEAVEFPAGGEKPWTLIGTVDVTADVSAGIYNWTFTDLDYKELWFVYKNMVGSTSSQSGIFTTINGAATKQACVKTSQNSNANGASGWTYAFLGPSGFYAVFGTPATLPANYAAAPLNAVLNPVPLNGDDMIHTLYLTANTMHKPVSGSFEVYGR